jgi:ABC-2 type transport system permease protein
MRWLFSDWLTAIHRSIRHTFRNVDSLITGLMLPIAILVLFVVVFGGAVDTGTDYVNYIVPGVIMVCIGYGSSTTAMIINRDMVGGLFDRFRTLPMARSSILVGHIIGSLARNLISTALVFVVAFAIGFRPNADALEWLAVAGLLALTILAFSWLSLIFGLIAKSVDAAGAIPFAVMFLPYISSAFVPLETLPNWLVGFAQHQPFTPIIETLRGLLIGTPIHDKALLAIVWSSGIMLASAAIALAVLKRKDKK